VDTPFYEGLQEKGEILYYQGTLFIGESKRHVKEGSVNGQLSLQGPCWGTWRGEIYGDCERQ
jgi:hypothetical protein